MKPGAANHNCKSKTARDFENKLFLFNMIKKMLAE